MQTRAESMPILVRSIAMLLALAVTIACGGSASNSTSGMTPSGSGANASSGGSGGSGGSAGSGASGGTAGSGGGASSSAQYLYTANTGSGDISGFQINSDGTLTSLAGFPVAASAAPFSFAAAKHSLLVGTNGASSSQMMLYNITPTNGKLSLSSSVQMATAPYVALDPSAQFAFGTAGPAANANATVSGFSVANGKFSAVPGSPYLFSIGGGSNPVSAQLIQIDPNGKFVYMPLTPQNQGTPTGWFGVAARNTNGSLSGFTPYSAGCISAGSMAVAAEGGNTLVFSSCVDDFNGTYWISCITVNGSTGAVTSTTGGFVDTTNTELFYGLAADPTGKWLAATDATHNTVHVMAIDPATGALTDAADHVFATGSAPNGAAFDVTGKFLYVINGGVTFAGLSGSNNVSAFAFDRSTGLLTPLSGSPYPVGQTPSSLAVAQP